jgi:hypothetical protein
MAGRDCEFKIEEPGVRIQNSEEKQPKLTSSQLLATDYLYVVPSS